MNKHLLYICVLLTFHSFGQGGNKNEKAKLWEKEKEYIIYQKNKKYKGPDEWYMGPPASLKEKDKVENSENNNYNGIQYDPQKIKKNRRKRNADFERGGESGTDNFNPRIDELDPIEFPEIDGPDVEPPVIPVIFWKVILFILLFSGIILLVYQMVKHRKPSNKKVESHSFENNWNPEVITKTELELLLEKSTEQENYRECVRIYFTFILKEIIKKGWIKWKKQKTNFDYILEMKGKPESSQFEECVRIYDLIWYGEYAIGKKVFESVQPTLDNYYQFLKTINE